MEYALIIGIIVPCERHRPDNLEDICATVLMHVMADNR